MNEIVSSMYFGDKQTVKNYNHATYFVCLLMKINELFSGWF